MPEHISYLGIILALIGTGMGLPIPEEVFVLVAGVASQQGQLYWPMALAACLVGALLGDCVMYSIGYHFGHGMVKGNRWFARMFNPARERRVEQLIHRHGLKVFLMARFLVGLRSPTYLAAGVLRVPFRRFLMVDLFCATAVIGTFFGLSYFFAEQIHAWWVWIRQAEIAVSIAIVCGLGGALGYVYLSRRRRWARVAQWRARREARRAAIGKPLPAQKSVA